MNNHKNSPLRKSGIAAAVLTLMSAALSAQTVTLSGIADAAARNVSNTGGSSVKSLSNPTGVEFGMRHSF
jgi:hypothetical protein